jgi:hypothetical protein
MKGFPKTWCNYMKYFVQRGEGIKVNEELRRKQINEGS